MNMATATLSPQLKNVLTQSQVLANELAPIVGWRLAWIIIRNIAVLEATHAELVELDEALAEFEAGDTTRLMAFIDAGNKRLAARPAARG